MISGLVALAVLLAAEPSPAPSAATAEEQDRALRAEQLDAAKRLVSTVPGSDDALYLVALVYQEQGNMAEVVNYCQRALQLNPNRADVYNTLGHVALLKEEYQQAVDAFAKARAIDPATPSVSYRMAQVLIRMGKVREALAAAEEDLKVSPRASQTYRLMGEAHFQLGEYEKAKERFLAAVAIEPELAEAYYGLATACARLRQQDKAREYRDKFKVLEAAALEAKRKWRAEYDPLLGSRQSTAHTHTDVGRVYERHGFAWTAEKLWRRAAELDPKNPACRFLLAQLYLQTNQKLAEAKALAAQAVELAPVAAGYFLLGQACERAGDRAGSRAAFQRAAQLEPGNAQYQDAVSRTKSGN